jgi:PAS domain S-box-containing protein
MAASFQGFQSLVDNSPDAISLVNARGEILYGNASNAKLFGYRPEELVGRDCMEFVHPDDRLQSSCLLREVVVKPTGPRSWDARVRRKDGRYCWVESTVSNLIHDLEVQAIVMHQRDIHERMEAQEKSQKQADELIKSNLRMEEFAYTVAHDLREPLRAISLYTQLLFKRVEMDAEQKEMAEFVIEGAGRMTRMVADLLSFARTGIKGPALPINLDDAVRQALKNLALEIQESGAVISIDELPVVHSDQTHLVSLFQNLISNAVKYRGDQPLSVQVSAEKRGLDWVIKIKDNGVGIAAKYQKQIFMPFVRLANHSVPGTGLGLAVCKRIVEGSGGTIWLDSEPGGGSTFYFTIVAHSEMPRSVSEQQRIA